MYVRYHFEFPCHRVRFGFLRRLFVFWGLVWGVCFLEFFDSVTRSAISGTPKMAKTTPILPFVGYQKWHFGCPNQKIPENRPPQTSPQNPQLNTLGNQIEPRKVILAILLILVIFPLKFPLKSKKCWGGPSRHAISKTKTVLSSSGPKEWD